MSDFSGPFLVVDAAVTVGNRGGGPQLGGSSSGFDNDSKKLSLLHPLPLNGVLERAEIDNE
jgi:hypothetical protein